MLYSSHASSSRCTNSCMSSADDAHFEAAPTAAVLSASTSTARPAQPLAPRLDHPQHPQQLSPVDGSAPLCIGELQLHLLSPAV
eukprot:5720745-Prymnesium_polylepis.1